MPDRFTIRAAAYLLLIKDNKVLLLRRFNTGWSDGMYTLAAGHLEEGEPVTAAMSREAKEEIGITINPADLHVVHVAHRNSATNYIDFYFTVSAWQGEPVNAEPDHCDDVQWFPLDALPANILPNVYDAITHYQAGEHFSELGWDGPIAA